MAKKKLTEKERLQKETAGLVDLVLPIPKEVMKFYEERVKPSIGRGFEFADVITERNGRLLQRVFCFQCYGFGGQKPSVRECARRYEGGNLIVSNLKGGWYMQTYRANDNCAPKDMHPSGWVPSDCYEVKAAKMELARPYLCLNEAKWLKKYPYCGWEQYKKAVGSKGFFNYLSRYRKEPRIELLIKGGYYNFVYYRGLNVEGRTFEEIFKVKQSFAKEYLKHGEPKDLSLLRKNEWIDNATKFNNFKDFIRRNDISKTTFTQKEIEYLMAFKISRPDSIYRDYLRFAKELGYPLTEKRYLYPKDLIKAHDDAYNELEDIKARVNDEQIKAICDACKSLCFEKDGLMIFPVSSGAELLTESKALDHCVRRYGPEIAMGKSLIMFIRRTEEPDKPFVTLELVKTADSKKNKTLVKQYKMVNQVRAYKNGPPDEDVSRFIVDWEKKNHLKGWSAA